MKPRNADVTRRDPRVVQPHGRVAAKFGRSWHLGRSTAHSQATQRALKVVRWDFTSPGAEVDPLTSVILCSRVVHHYLDVWVEREVATVLRKMRRGPVKISRAIGDKRTSERRGVPSGSMPVQLVGQTVHT